MMFPDQKTVAGLRKQYPAGTRVELVCMDDPYQKMPPSLKGAVDFVDDTGTVFVHWENGSHLGAVYGKDQIRGL